MASPEYVTLYGYSTDTRPHTEPTSNVSAMLASNRNENIGHVPYNIIFITVLDANCVVVMSDLGSHVLKSSFDHDYRERNNELFGDRPSCIVNTSAQITGGLKAVSR